MTRRGERVAVALLLLAAPLSLLAVARQGDFTALAAFSPLFFPRIVLWGWAALAAFVLVVDVRALRRERGAEAADGGGDGAGDDARLDRATWVRIAAVVLAMGAFVQLVTTLGFVLSGVAFTLAVLLVLGIRSWPTLLAYGTLLPIALFALFHHGLGLPLPTSPFSYLF